ncbi:hypothetical protein [Lysinibacillus sp. NPDC086135]|uniref:hypothetical protein n=1 Tax=Lysinibacillus sp. NPDC086135 TaxID=3364130 RepID=UPI0038301BE2
MMEFIMINNQLISDGNEFQLTPQELYVYSLLSISRDYREDIYISASLLHAKGQIELASNKKRAVKAIKDTLISLRDKKVIRFTSIDGELVGEFNANDILIAELVEFEDISHTQLKFDVFNELTDIRQLYVYLTTYRWANSENGIFTCSKSRWAMILNCSESTAVQAVNETIEAGLIHKNIGDYNDTGKQNTNQYRTTPFEDDEITHHSFKKKYAEKVVEEETDLEHITVEQLKETEQRFNKFKDENGEDVFPIEQDYVAVLDLRKQKREVGLTDIEKRVLRAGENRIKKLKKQDYLIDEYGNEFKIVDRHIENAKLYIQNRDEMNTEYH